MYFLQALIIYENIFKKSNSVNLDQILSILNFVYYSRSRDLADPEFEEINPDSLLDKKLLLENFKLFNQKLEKVDSININKLLNSTTHFSIIDNKGNIISATSSIESSFGSRLFTNGFFLNNQLTDFSFKIKDKNNNLIKNRPEGGKRPLSSMSPIIVLDENDHFFNNWVTRRKSYYFLYFRVLIDVLYKNVEIYKSIESPNYIKINGNIFLEDEILQENYK